MNITIRKLTIKDIELYKSIRLEALENAPTNFGSSHTEEAAFKSSMWENRLSKNTTITLGAFDQDKIVGLTVLVMSPRYKMKHIAHINSVYVKPEYRGNNIASNILSIALKELIKHHIERVNLSVVSDNTSAITLYEKHGFITYGLEPQTIKYKNQYYDLLLMSKTL